MSKVQKVKSNCCGCTACANICPKNAIHMAQDEKGFYYPEVDDNNCIKCGLCQKVCDFTKFTKEHNSAFVKSYAARNKNTEQLMSSRSGGFFSAIAEFVIMRGGVCYGAVLDSNLHVVHRRADTLKDCWAFKGSKYVQSRIDVGIFREIKTLLDCGKIVLFSGTGCQVHGLLSYLDQTKTNRTGLITVDFVCHGVPSPKVWDEYTKEIEQRSNKNLKSVNFRDKVNFGWASHVETYKFEDGSSESSSKWADVYYLHCMFRESCYKCPYTTPYRNSDFTIGDYWGHEKVTEGYNDNKGLSLVITHNEKAEKIITELNDIIFIEATDLGKSMQPQLRYPAYRGLEYNRFWNIWKNDKRKAVRKFFFPSITRQLYMQSFKNFKKVIKKMLRR